MIRRLTAAIAAAMLLAPAGSAWADEHGGAAGNRPQAPSTSAPASPFSALEEEAIRSVVRDYLIENPEVIVEAIEALRAQQREEELRTSQAAVADNAEALYEDPDAPVLGNPDGDVTIVEFFDYRCGYCKRVFPTLMEVVESDGNVRLVMKEWPILGPESDFAARAALAAQEQGKYADFHVKLMGAKGELSEDAVMTIARSAGLDTEQLRADMADPGIEAALRRTFTLAEKLGIRGTPAFVIGGELVPGAVGADRMRALIEAKRQDAG